MILAVTAIAVLPGLAVASTPPKGKSLVVDVANASLSGVRLGSPSSRLVALWGFPDYSGAIEPHTTEMLWSRTTSLSNTWAVVNLTSLKSTAIVKVRYSGLFHTTRGDSRGTTLATFLKHWPRGHEVTRVLHSGKTVEYNVAIGRVVFGFDTKKTLQAVALAPAATAPTLCAIPAICVVSTLS